MKNNEVGRSLIKLIFIIVILSLIVIGGIILAKRVWKKSNEKDIKTDLLYIQAKCKVIYDKHIVNGEESLIGEKIEEYSENEKVNEFIKNSEEEWYKLKQSDLEQIGLGYLKEENGYLINYKTEEVIYGTGVEEKNGVFYKLSDILRGYIETEEENNSVNEQSNDNNTTEESNEENNLEQDTIN